MTSILDKLPSKDSIKNIISWTNNNKGKTAVICILAGLIGRNLSIRLYRKYKHHPPGPIGLPFVGLIPFFVYFQLFVAPKDENGENNKNVNGLTEYLAKQYGPIYQINFGKPMDKFINISNSRFLRKLMTDKNYKDIATSRWGKLPAPLMTSMDDDEESFFHLEGQEWSKRRKIFLSAFNKLLTTKFMNKVSGTAIKRVLFDEINKKCIENGEAINIRKIMQFTTFQTIFYVNFDRFCDKNDEFFMKFKNEIELQTDMVLSPEIFKIYEYPKSEWKQRFPKIMAARDRLSTLTKQLMNQRRAELKERGIKYKDPESLLSPKAFTKTTENDLSAVIKDLEFDSYLDYLLKLVDQGAIKNSTAEVDCLLLFQAGYQNNSLGLEFVITYLAKYIDLQQKIRDELYAVHDINIEERKSDEGIIDFNLGLVNKCPLLRAFIYETLRVASFTKAGTLRRITRDVEMEWEGQKYVLPKGYVFTFQSEVIMTKDTNQNEGWIVKKGGKVGDFNIDNFLNENKKFRLNESMSLFGYGARDCPGKSFAIKSIQIVAGYLLMNYKIEFGQEEKRNDPANVKIRCELASFVKKIDPEIPLKFSKI